jgi:hypothetical protein
MNNRTTLNASEIATSAIECSPREKYYRGIGWDKKKHANSATI